MLALIAGEGELPGVVLGALQSAGTPVILCELEGHSAHIAREVLRFRVETLGTFIAALQARGTTRVCFAGRVARPALDPARIDNATMPLVPRMIQALQKGDDAALRIVVQFFEEGGMEVVAAHDLVPSLMPRADVLGQVAPTDDMARDAQRGFAVIEALGRVDVGQACVIARGQALAVEAMGGTDWMLRSLMVPAPVSHPDTAGWDDPLGMAADWLTGDPEPGPEPGGAMVRDPALPSGGILVKAAKPDQDLRMDVPTIGPQTVARAAEIGLKGIAVKAHEVMILDQATCIERANASGLALWVVE